MMSHSGIGTCIRNLMLPLSKPPFDLTILGGVFEGIKSVHFGAPIYSLKEQLKFPSTIPSSDLFWSPHYNVPLFRIKAKKRIVTIHDVCHLAIPFSRGKRVIARMLLRGACQKSQLIITDSQFSKLEIIKYLEVDEQNIQVIYPGVNLNEFSPENKSEEIVRKYDPYFLFVGNFKVHKNLETLVRAFELLKSKDARLLLVGKYKGLKSSDSAIFERVQSSLARERIHLLGEVPQSEIRCLYASAKALVFPSLYEGFGLPPLEAMASGCPVLASTSASIPEVCADAALYFDPRSAEELSNQMDQVLGRGNDSLKAKGFRRCREFSWNKTADGYRTLFQKIGSL
ncbi:MAG: glycosyltransferase family 4 protein [Verrucomicrobia bacterium]|nr:glycosyltransferase family 4 protein [Verrucomicrobiota bacterium]